MGERCLPKWANAVSFMTLRSSVLMRFTVFISWQWHDPFNWQPVRIPFLASLSLSVGRIWVTLDPVRGVCTKLVSTNERSRWNACRSTYAQESWFHQCGGSVTFWCGSGRGSGSSDPYLWLTDPNADPVGPKTSKNIRFLRIRILNTGIFTSFFKDKKS